MRTRRFLVKIRWEPVNCNIIKKEQQTGYPGALKTASGYGKMNSKKQLKEDMTEDE